MGSSDRLYKPVWRTDIYRWKESRSIFSSLLSFKTDYIVRLKIDVKVIIFPDEMEQENEGFHRMSLFTRDYKRWSILHIKWGDTVYDEMLEPKTAKNSSQFSFIYRSIF